MPDITNRLGDRREEQEKDFLRGGRAAVAALTIHHVRDKWKLFKDLRNLLNPDGLLLYMDITIAQSPALEARFLENWKTFMRNSPWPNRKIETIISDHLQNDVAETVEEQLKYLREAGFRIYDLVRRHEKFAAFQAHK